MATTAPATDQEQAARAWPRGRCVRAVRDAADRTRGAVDTTELIKTDAVEPLDGSWLRLTFSDRRGQGRRRWRSWLAVAVFEPIRKHRELFEQVRVNPDTQTIEWLGEVDLDPDVLYGRFEPGSGARIRRRTVREPIATRVARCMKQALWASAPVRLGSPRSS